MEYRNKKTGEVISTTHRVNGKNWEPVVSAKEATAPKAGKNGTAPKAGKNGTAPKAGKNGTAPKAGKKGEGVQDSTQKGNEE